jgi:crotonobetainyl-CoA:carnitine CoA-transferase CaiB-like acyl-CoA transferase
MTDQPAPSALDGIRVVDLANSRAELAGRILAELGAEVIKVEPPGGCDARRLPPFREGSDESLYWAAVGRGKHSVVLDLTNSDDRGALSALIADADVLIESFDPGVLEQHGLDYATVAALNPALVHASITPFGQTGPLARAPAIDLTIEAAGGLLALQGDGDRPPVAIGLPQASFHAGVQAAADILIALYERNRSGQGQHLDVSMQAAMVWTLMNATGYPANTGGDPPGTCANRSQARPTLVPGMRAPRAVACRDGHVVIGTYQPGIGERTFDGMVRWLAECDAIDADLAARSWLRYMNDLTSGVLAVDDFNRAYDAISAFVATLTKRQIMDGAIARKLLLAPLYDVADLTADPQLAARNYWVDIGGVSHPGAFARLSATPLRLERAAPALGADQTRLATRKALADHGATVVHVESAQRTDLLRSLPPFKGGEAGLNRSQFFANFNTSKLGLKLELNDPNDLAVARRLADWADVVVESFTPGTMARYGLDYATLSADREDLIMLSTCMRGQTGPERAYTGFGNQGAAIAGLAAITGWPDRAPAGPWGAYTDFISPRFGIAAIAAALLHRDATGRGQHIDLSQIEAGIQFQAPLVLDYTVNGRVARAAGNASAYACPHGTYATRGVERYIAIGIVDAHQWRALCRLVRFDPELARCESLAARIAARDTIDATLAAWCAGGDAFELASRLQSVGVPSYPLLRPTDLVRDPQLAHRGFFVTLDHPEMGPTPYDGPVTQFSRTPARLRRPAPLLGEHSDEVRRWLAR